MGHTLAEWQDKIADLVRDPDGVDLSALQISVGLAPALAKYSSDRPRTAVVEVAGAASSYLELPAGWVEGFSSLSDIEYPARLNPPAYLDAQYWRITRDPVDVDETRILLLTRTPVASEYVRLTFTAPWPMPAESADDDPIDDLAFEAVTALAASFCCVSLAGEAARSRWGSLPTDTNGSQGTQDRRRQLAEMAALYRSAYDSFIGIGATSGTGGSGAGNFPILPASGSFDLDPSHGSIFHGGRR